MGKTTNYSTHVISVKEKSRRKPSTLSNIKAATLEKMIFETEQLVKLTRRNVPKGNCEYPAQYSFSAERRYGRRGTYQSGRYEKNTRNRVINWGMLRMGTLYTSAEHTVIISFPISNKTKHWSR